MMITSMALRTAHASIEITVSSLSPWMAISNTIVCVPIVDHGPENLVYVDTHVAENEPWRVGIDTRRFV
jgi:hypothetical protein